MAGVSAFTAAYNNKALVPQLDFGWDTYKVRRSRYFTYENYENNTAYATINNQAAALKLDNKLYKHVRGIYNPVSRFVNLNVAYIAGGEIDMDSLTVGCLPVVTDNEAIRTALLKGLEWSRWGEYKALYVATGVNKGDTYIKVIDDRLRQQVRLEVLPPEFVRDIEFDEVGNVKAIVIEYERDEVVDVQAAKPGVLGQMLSFKGKNTYTYTEKITKEKFYTYKDGEPFAFYFDENGNGLTEWDNEYGFVPVVHQVDTPAGLGLKMGKNGYYNDLPKINEINDQASIISDKIRQILQPIVYAEGVTNQAQIQPLTEDRDQLAILYGPANSKLTPIMLDLNISAALENLHSMLNELKNDMPILALQDIRQQSSNLSGVAIENMFGDSISSIKMRRSRFNAAFIRASQMMIGIGGYNGYEGFEGFNLDSYKAGDLQFYIKDTRVINDSLSMSDHVNALSTISGMPAPLQRLALQKLDYNEDDIDEVVAATEEQVRFAARGFADSLFGSGDNGDNEDEPQQLGRGRQVMQLPDRVGAPA